jgi:hypothetical protein
MLRSEIKRVKNGVKKGGQSAVSRAHAAIAYPPAKSWQALQTDEWYPGPTNRVKREI